MRPLAPCLCLLALLLSALTSCNKIQFKSIRTGTVVPAEFAGEWVGEWHSSQSVEVGEITLRVQEYEANPVVGVLVEHPCLPPSSYEIVLTNQTIQLLRNGVSAFVGTLGSDRKIVGTYNCPQDQGTWEVSWRNELPTIIDLTGIWTGQIQSQAGITEMTLELDQRVVQNSLEVTGLLTLPQVLISPLPVRGVVREREGFFELGLQTVAGIVPHVIIGGLGDSTALIVNSGLVSTSGQPLPFTQGIATFALQPPVTQPPVTQPE